MVRQFDLPIEIRFLKEVNYLKDEYGRIEDKAHVIRSLDKLRMAHLFNDMKNNPEKYPDNVERWLEWLNKDSGDSIDNL